MNDEMNKSEKIIIVIIICLILLMIGLILTGITQELIMKYFFNTFALQVA